MTLKDYITLCIALYAACISTLTLIWNIVQWHKQRGKLKVKSAICLDKGNYTIGVDPGEWGDVLRVDAVNIGKANITITEIGLGTARPYPWRFWKARPQVRFPFYSTSPTPLPYTLEFSKEVYWLFESNNLLDIRTIKEFFVKDSHGQVWHISKRQLKHMRRVIRSKQILMAEQDTEKGTYKTQTTV